MGRPRTDVKPGDRYAFLVVLGEAPAEPRPWGGSPYRRIFVRCDCGAEVSVRLCDLRSGQTKGCGCGIARAAALRTA